MRSQHQLGDHLTAQSAGCNKQHTIYPGAPSTALASAIWVGVKKTASTGAVGRSAELGKFKTSRLSSSWICLGSCPSRRAASIITSKSLTFPTPTPTDSEQSPFKSGCIRDKFHTWYQFTKSRLGTANDEGGVGMMAQHGLCLHQSSTFAGRVSNLTTVTKVCVTYSIVQKKLTELHHPSAVAPHAAELDHQQF